MRVFLKERSTLTGVAVTAGILLALVAGSTAGAIHIWDDVDDNKFYAEAVEWATDNGITLGTSETTFSPERTITRAEAVTFLNRYDTNLIQPELADRYTKAETDAALADHYTKAETDTALADHYTKAETDTALADHYTKAETDVALDAVADAASDQFGGMNFIGHRYRHQRRRERRCRHHRRRDHQHRLRGRWRRRCRDEHRHLKCQRRLVHAVGGQSSSRRGHDRKLDQ